MLQSQWARCVEKARVSAVRMHVRSFLTVQHGLMQSTPFVVLIVSVGNVMWARVIGDHCVHDAQ